ncbi:hypothetical protein [Larkinella soli]|uniref:hypothetical protein n=1 Tax=Larkinella soli TaxID=1770527 RepID=UPI000FFBA7E0|nr:hypothetical protein [Larkinella soli]
MSFGQFRVLAEGYWQKQRRLQEEAIRRERVTATLIRNQYAKKPIEPHKLWPLPSDRPDTQGLEGGQILKLLYASLKHLNKEKNGTPVNR